ncbi:MAG TPA: aminoglycoside phosphotransferase family protein [Dongiaceae bacterium]|nr:aminoglycoside phosphotransferase family protein [Dongiaceae bacterium]
MERRAAIVLVRPDGTVIGRLPPMPVATPWWQEVEPVAAAVRARHGIEITVLRLLEAECDAPPGGTVTYLAETAQPIAAEPWPGTLDENPLRLPYARPGGPTADLDWAMSVLARSGQLPIGAAVQIRTWNLSSLWRIPLRHATAWLKVIPPFLAPEGALLECLAGPHVPRLLGHEGRRSLIAGIPGGDLYEAPLPALREMVAILVALQREWMGRVETLLDLGLPDCRGPALGAPIGDVFARNADALSAEDRAMLAAFVARLPERFARLAECGIADTLIHGDFHPGNFRGDGRTLVLLDWGDSGIGHPLLDQPAFLSRIPADAVAPVRAHWIGEWRKHAPGSDPDRAAALLAPIAAARQAAIYQRFLDSIEPSEHPYHRGDPKSWLERAAALLHEGTAG